MSDLYSNDKIREKAEQLVQQNVHYCVSTLISNIARPERGIDSETICRGLDISGDDDLLPLLEIKDYEEPADQYIRNQMDRTDLITWLEENDVELVRGNQAEDEDDDVALTDKELEALAISKLEGDHDDAHKDFCEEFNIEPDTSEVYEHWIVDSWFAGKLEGQGHPIARDFLGMTIWGRPTTGQTISMDGVVLRIAADLIKED